MLERDRPAPEPPRCLVLLAKQPRPGRVKTRLQGAVGPDAAARIARACLADTVAALLDRPADRLLAAVEGAPDGWLPRRFDVVAQPAGGLDVRLAAALAAALPHPGAGPALLVGMDTPQLGTVLPEVDFRGVDAVLGPTDDGGYWAIGLRAARDDAVLGVPMSTAGTFAAQLDRLRSLGLAVRLLPRLRDVDVPADAEDVAARYPRTRFAAAWRSRHLAPDPVGGPDPVASPGPATAPDPGPAP